jgi:hypothetical protein
MQVAILAVTPIPRMAMTDTFLLLDICSPATMKKGIIAHAQSVTIWMTDTI